MSGSLQTAKTGLIQGNNIMSVKASNMAIANTVGGKGGNYFTHALTGSGFMSKGTRGVTGSLIQNIDQPGAATNVSNPMYTAAGDNGFFVVDGGFTRVGTWFFDKNGDMVNHLGKKLMVYQLNEDGQKVDPLNPDNIADDNTSQIFMRGLNRYELNVNARATDNIDLSYLLPGEVAEGKTESVDINVFDSKGIPHNLRFNFVKLPINTSNEITQVNLGGGVNAGPSTPVPIHPGTTSAWTIFVESTAKDNTDTIQGNFTKANMQTTPVMVQFDDKGRLLKYHNGTAHVDDLPKLQINWGNLSAASNIQLNFGVVGGDNGLASRGREPIVRLKKPNGNPDGVFRSIQWDREGNGYITYDNGVQEKKFQLAMARFVNANGLIYDGDGNYVASVDSGQPLYGTPGDGIIGPITPSAIEESNVSEIDTQVDIVSNQRYYMAQATVFRVAREMAEALDTLA